MASSPVPSRQALEDMGQGVGPGQQGGGRAALDLRAPLGFPYPGPPGSECGNGQQSGLGKVSF